MNRDVTVREVMDREFVAASESDSVRGTLELLLRNEDEPAVVLRGKEPVGVLSDRDVLAFVLERNAGLDSVSVGDLMTESVPIVSPDRTLAEARDRMTTRSTRWLVVSDGSEPAGVVTQHDVLSGSTIGTEIDAAERTDGRATQFVEANRRATAIAAETSSTDGFDDQGICEKCGSLRSDLTSFNGQLLCVDCRDI